jgi:hypothetical protein
MTIAGAGFMIHDLQPKRLVATVMAALEDGRSWVHMGFFSEKGVLHFEESDTQLELSMSETMAMSFIATLQVNVALVAHLRAALGGVGEPASAPDFMITVDRDLIACRWRPDEATSWSREDDHQVLLRMSESFAARIAHDIAEAIGKSWADRALKRLA